MPTSDNQNNGIRKAEKTTAVLGLIVLILVSITVIAAAAVFMLRASRSGEAYADPRSAAEGYLSSLVMISSDGSRLYIDDVPDEPGGQQLQSALENSWSYEITDVSQSRKDASVTVQITCPDFAALKPYLLEETRSLLRNRVQNATSKSEIYDAGDLLRTAVFDSCFQQALNKAAAELPKKNSLTASAVLTFAKSLAGWNITNAAQPVKTLDLRSAELKDYARENLGYISMVWKIPEDALTAPIPDASRYLETADPSAVSSLLDSVYAKNLLQGQSLNWNPSITFLPGSTITCYLDETILMIQWQEQEQGIVGTFSEVVIADGSQFRRKIAGDAFGDMNFKTCTDFARETNAVLALGGDFYNHGRNCGIVVLNRNICRFEPSTCDVCYVTESGDLLFSYRNQFSTVEEAQTFVRDNDIVFSLSFGPVLIDNGQNVTPDNYPYGEINDTYARAALGLLGQRHYLTLNLNCGNNETYGYATLKNAADAMMSRGCSKAYALDGGQTATTVVNGILKNPVQFGYEKALSDIIYFGTSVPDA